MVCKAVDILLGIGPAESHDAADAGGYGSFTDDLEEADLPGGTDMGSPAEFHRFTVADYPHLVAVFFGKQCHRAHLAGFFDRHVAVFVQRDVFPD